MLTPIYKNRFLKDLKQIKKRQKDTKKLKAVMQYLIGNTKLAQKYQDHALKGEYTDCRECHIEPDWLLIYLVQNKTITFVRTGTHSDLFKT